MAFIVSFSGDAQLSRALQELGTRGAARASRVAATAAARHLAAAARPAAPVGKDTKQRQAAMANAPRTKRGGLKRRGMRLRPSIGVRSVKENGSVVGVKVSVAAYHGAIVTLGTKKRFRKSTGKAHRAFVGEALRRGITLSKRMTQISTGAVKPRPFFRHAVTANISAATGILASKMRQQIEAEVAKAKR